MLLIVYIDVLSRILKLVWISLSFHLDLLSDLFDYFQFNLDLVMIALV